VLTACAGADRPAGGRLPGPTTADREVSQLLATTRRLQAEWEVVAAERRARRERLARLDHRPAVIGLRRRLGELARASGLLWTDASVRALEPAARSVRIEGSGPPGDVRAFCEAVAREWPGSWASDREAPPAAEPPAWVRVRAEACLPEVVPLPPPSSPPPAFPDVPPGPETAVPLLRGHLVRLHRALEEGEAALVRLREVEALAGHEVVEPVRVTCGSKL